MVAASHGERPPLHVVPSTSPVSVNWCSTQHAGVNVGTGEGGVVGTDVGTNVGSLVGWNVGVGADVGTVVGVGVGTFVGAAVGVGVGFSTVGTGVGKDVGKIVGTGVGTSAVGPTVVSSSRRAPSRRPLDRRAFGPLRGGRCPPTTALRNKHRHRQAIMRMNDGSLLLPMCFGQRCHAGFQASSDGKASTTRIARPTTGSER